MWIITATQHIPSEVNMKGLRSAVYRKQWMMICCGMAVKSMGMLGVSVRKMEALTVKMESDTDW